MSLRQSSEVYINPGRFLRRSQGVSKNILVLASPMISILYLDDILLVVTTVKMWKSEAVS